MMKWMIQKLGDEGTAEPFIARLMAGAFELRDQVVNNIALSYEDEKSQRDAFDQLYGLVLDEMFAMRKAAKAIHDLVEEHRAKVDSSDVCDLQQNAIKIPDSIEYKLRDLVSQFLNTAVRAAKSIQKVTAHFGLDIGGFFAKDSNFQGHMDALEAAGHKPLVDYLQLARRHWSQQLIDRRNTCEHKSWTLPDVRYPSTADGRLTMIEPEIDGLAVTKWVSGHCRHVLAFVESTLVYAFQTALIPHRVVFVEIPIMERNPDYPKRFRVTFPVIEGVTPWYPQYEPEGFM